MMGEGRIFLRGKTYWVAYYVDGKEHRESSHSANEDAARKLLKRRLRERVVHEDAGRPFVGPAQKRIRASELLDAFEKDAELRGLRGLDRLRSHLRPVRDAFGDRKAVSITPEAVDRYVEQRLQDGKAPATVNREVGALGQAFRLAVRRNLLASAPAIRRLSELGNARQGFFERADFEAVVRHLPAYLQDFTRFAYLTGWRKGEIASLTWADVDRQGRVIRLRPEASKNREGRSIALEGELWAIVERRWQARLIGNNGQGRLAEYVFHRNGRPIGNIRNSWRAATKAAGLDGKLFHDLRRTAVRNMIRAGVPERMAMQISGHKTRAIFDRYNIVSETDLRNAVRKTQDYLAAVPVDRSVVVLPLEEDQATVRVN